MDTCQTGFTLVCAVLLWTKQILGQSCYMPDGQQGHCVPLNECPKVFDIFADPPRGNETYLRQLLCKNVNQLEVCCDAAASERPNAIFADMLHHTNFDYCSPWHLDIDFAVILTASEDFNVERKRCLGILANPRYVITPAQCVVPKTQGKQFTVVGVKFRGKNNNSPTFGIEEVISHPFFDPVTGTNDIALLRLNQTVSEDDVQALYRVSYSVYSPIGRNRMLTYSNLALSAIERGPNKPTVRMTSLLSIKECDEDFLQEGASVALTNHDLCIKNVKNVTKLTCNEFTGVPLFLDVVEFCYVGFSSSRTVCNGSLPLIYTNANAYLGWLEGQMKPWPINNDPCTTPNGEIGECWDLPYCPALLDAFSSLTNATEAYLRRFICGAVKKEFPVCCVTSSNSTIVLKKDEPKLADVPIKFLEPHLCGLQHRDDYFSSSAAIAIDEFPWIALIREGIEYNIFPRCTGTLINSRYVISTGYCVAEVNMDTALVRLGNYNQHNETSCVKNPDIDTTDCTETEKYGVEDKILHPFFSKTFGLNDIGLLRLNKTVTYTDFVRPICLPIPGTVTPKVGDTMYMSDWSWQNVGSKHGIKKKVLTQLLHEEQCLQPFPPYSNIKHRNIICTLDYQNNTEFADRLERGGPLMFHNNYRWYIAGILWLPTERNVPNSYFNVSKYINWIIDSMEPW